jgi:hypothetical protein
MKFEFGDEKGSILEFASFQNCSTFYTKTLKTQNTKVVALEKIYKLGFNLFPKFCLDLELFQKGVKRSFLEIRVLNSIDYSF